MTQEKTAYDNQDFNELLEASMDLYREGYDSQAKGLRQLMRHFFYPYSLFHNPKDWIWKS
jgi:hypothetical protein